MVRIRYVAALLHSDDEIVSSWIDCSDAEAKEKGRQAVEDMGDPTGLTSFITDNGMVVIPNAHIQYLALEQQGLT